MIRRLRTLDVSNNKCLICYEIPEDWGEHNRFHGYANLIYTVSGVARRSGYYRRVTR